MKIRYISLIFTLPLFFVLLLFSLVIDWYNDSDFSNSMLAKLDKILVRYRDWYNDRRLK